MSTLRPEAAHRGHHAQKGRRGVWVPLALVRGRRLDQLLVQVEEAPGHVRWGELSVEVWR